MHIKGRPGLSLRHVGTPMIAVGAQANSWTLNPRISCAGADPHITTGRRTDRPYGLALRPPHADRERAALDRRRLAAVAHGHGQRLTRDVVLVRADGAEQLAVAAELEPDAVLDGEAGRLARVLDGVHDLAHEPLAAEVVVELELERHGVRALALELVAGERAHGEDEVVGAELVVVAVDAHADAGAVAQRAGDMGRV